MRVWVTGGSGFLGRQIVAALRDMGAEPVAMAGARPDLLDPAARALAVWRANAAILVHAAWITRSGVYWDSAENPEWTAATLDLARLFAASGGRRFVLVGSCAEYDWQRPARAPWTERRPTRPGSRYGAAKLAAWHGLECLAAATGLSVANARVFIPIGQHEAPARLLPSLIRAAMSHEPLATGPADLARDFIDVRDAGEAVARIALAGVAGPVNVATGRTVSIAALARLVGAPVRLGGRPARPGEPLWMAGDPARLHAATGFVPRHTLAETVADAIDDWRVRARAAA